MLNLILKILKCIIKPIVSLHNKYEKRIENKLQLEWKTQENIKQREHEDKQLQKKLDYEAEQKEKDRELKRYEISETTKRLNMAITHEKEKVELNYYQKHVNPKIELNRLRSKIKGTKPK